MDIKVVAGKLKAALEPLLGIELPIFHNVGAKDESAPAIRIVSHTWDNAYSGARGGTDMIYVELARPLRVHFEFSDYDGGECEEWALDVSGATPDELAALRDVFSPAQYTGPWRPAAKPRLTVDGVHQPF